MASCLYSLATNHNVQEKLRKEVQDAVGKESRVTPEHVQNMHYLRDCIKETQRLEILYEATTNFVPGISNIILVYSYIN